MTMYTWDVGHTENIWLQNYYIYEHDSSNWSKQAPRLSMWAAAEAPGESVPAPRASCRAEDSPGSAAHTGTHSHVSSS